jgi:hypothetical protein
VIVWSFGWWEHALATGTNPFVSHAAYAPYGINIAWTYTAPGLALAFSPLTAVVGPVASYNVAYVLAPALAAWTGYLFCRYLTGSLWAALIGGYLFGFSDAALRQTKEGALNLSWIFLLPLIGLVVLRYIRTELSGRGLAWRLGVLIAFQLTISTEFALSATLALAACLLLGYVFAAQLRPVLRRAVAPIAAGYGLGLVFAAPFTYYLLSDFPLATMETQQKLNGSDALGAIVPNEVVAIGGNDLGTIANHAASKMAYLGLPAVLIIALYAYRSWRTSAGRFVLAAFALAFVVTLGLELQVYGHTFADAPWWSAATHVPGLQDALPYRFGVLLALAASVIVSLWTARTRGLVFRRPYVLPLAAAAALAPALWHPSLFELKRPPTSSFLTTDLFRSCIGRHSTLLVFPGGYDALLWQAQSGFRYDLATDDLQPFPEDGAALNRFDQDPFVWDLHYAGDAHPTFPRLLAFIGSHGVDRVVSTAPDGYPTTAQLRKLGRPTAIGDAVVSPGCGQPSLRTRDLSRYVLEWEVKRTPSNERPHLVYCGRTGAQLQPTGLTPPPGTTIANYVAGQGITCLPPPPGYKRHGLASATLGVPAGTYPFYSA